MTHDPTLSRLLASVDAATLARHLQWFSGVPRDTGGAGEGQAAAYLAAELAAAGVPVTMHEFDAFLSYPRDAGVVFIEWDRKLMWAGTGTGLYCVTSPALKPMPVSEWTLPGLNVGHS